MASRLLWFVGLWVAGVLSVGVVGYAIKLMLGDLQAFAEHLRFQAGQAG